jgi:hypothetical protein
VTAFRRLTQLAAGHEIEAVTETAVRLLRVDPLRAAGSLQLAAAYAAAEGRQAALGVATLDDRLASSAKLAAAPRKIRICDRPVCYGIA